MNNKGITVFKILICGDTYETHFQYDQIYGPNLVLQQHVSGAVKRDF